MKSRFPTSQGSFSALCDYCRASCRALPRSIPFLGHRSAGCGRRQRRYEPGHTLLRNRMQCASDMSFDHTDAELSREAAIIFHFRLIPCHRDDGAIPTTCPSGPPGSVQVGARTRGQASVEHVRHAPDVDAMR
mmetsp:Transcript_30597/g.93636  ORF Transcript_30597/g.93636 Transcript_30597/m.93636 type:complete len:133 (-) Transcript_30597:160-558(-)|eukprot:scaffold68723_cov26-Tisochrysis_lutea.AAC.2